MRKPAYLDRYSVRSKGSDVRPTLQAALPAPVPTRAGMVLLAQVDDKLLVVPGGPVEAVGNGISQE